MGHEVGICLNNVLQNVSAVVKSVNHLEYMQSTLAYNLNPDIFILLPVVHN